MKRNQGLVFAMLGHGFYHSWTNGSQRGKKAITFHHGGGGVVRNHLLGAGSLGSYLHILLTWPLTLLSQMVNTR